MEARKEQDAVDYSIVVTRSRIPVRAERETAVGHEEKVDGGDKALSLQKFHFKEGVRSQVKSIL